MTKKPKQLFKKFRLAVGFENAIHLAPDPDGWKYGFFEGVLVRIREDRVPQIRVGNPGVWEDVNMKEDVNESKD